jgi:periplasmic protein CpxP/Spy
MIASRTLLAYAAAAALGTGLVAWSPIAPAQSSAATPPSSTISAPSSTAAAQTVKPRSSAQVEAHIAQLHRELKITKDQQGDWDTLAQDMRDNAQTMSKLIAERNEAAKAKPMTAVDNLKNYAEIADAHADGLKKIVPDFEKLYGDMSPSQKKTADAVFNRRVNQRVRTTAAPASGSRS